MNTMEITDTQPATLVEASVPTRDKKENAAATSPERGGQDASTSGEMPTLEELGITDPAMAAKLEACEARWHVTERMDTEVVFIRGAVVAEGRPVCDSQKQFEIWTKTRLKVTRRGAENYERVHHSFGERSDRFIAAGVGPTVMYKLLAAEPEKVEVVLRHYEAGGSMTAQEAETFIGQADANLATDEEVAELAGADGIRSMVREKVKTTIPDIIQRMHVIMAACLEALDDHHRGVRVKKGELADKIEHHARVLRSTLENLAFIVKPNPHGDSWRLFSQTPSHETRWGKLTRLLNSLGGRNDWSDPVGPWLIDEVIPALEWGPGGKLAEAVRAEDAKRLEAIADAKVKAKADRDKVSKPAPASGSKTKPAGAAKAAGPVDSKVTGANAAEAVAEIVISAAEADRAMAVSKAAKSKPGEVKATSAKAPKSSRGKRHISREEGIAMMLEAAGLTSSRS